MNPAADDQASFYHLDQLGSVRALTKAAGTPINTYNYDAYGNRTTSTGTVYNPFGYTGEYTDSESGMVYLRARYYDPSTQPFVTVDPAVTQTGQSYTYAAGSPTNLSDPSGLWAIGLCVNGSFEIPLQGKTDTHQFGRQPIRCEPTFTWEYKPPAEKAIRAVLRATSDCQAPK